MLKLSSVLGAVLSVALAASAPQAQETWPSKPVKLVVPFAAGGNTDAVARVTADYLQKKFGGAFVIENRGGGGGIVGTDAVARAAPDGYTFCVCSIGSITVAPSLQKLPYEPLADLEPISPLSTNALALVVPPSLGITSVADLIRVAKEKPGFIEYGSSGVGGLMHIAPLLFQVRTGTKLTHVPFRGGAPAVAAALGGQVKLVFANMSDALPQLEGKTLIALAVTTRTRSPQLPQVPTLADSGVPDFHVESWNALFAPAGTSHELIARISAAVEEMSKDPEVQRRFATFGSQTAFLPPDRFKADLQAETVQWRGVLEQAGLAQKQ